MSTQERRIIQLTTKLAEVSELLEEMIVVLEIRGFEKQDDIIKRAIRMQKEIKELQEAK